MNEKQWKGGDTQQKTCKIILVKTCKPRIIIKNANNNNNAKKIA